MEPQDLIALAGFFISFVIWIKLDSSIAILLSLFLTLLLQICSHFAYPDRYADAMWLFGAAISLFIQVLAVGVGGALGFVGKSLSKKR